MAFISLFFFLNPHSTKITKYFEDFQAKEEKKNTKIKKFPTV